MIWHKDLLYWRKIGNFQTILCCVGLYYACFMHISHFFTRKTLPIRPMANAWNVQISQLFLWRFWTIFLLCKSKWLASIKVIRILSAVKNLCMQQMESDCKEDTFPTIMWFEVSALCIFLVNCCSLSHLFYPIILGNVCLIHAIWDCFKTSNATAYTIVFIFIPKVHTQNKLVLLPFSLHWILWLHMTHRMIISKRFIVS